VPIGRRRGLVRTLELGPTQISGKSPQIQNRILGAEHKYILENIMGERSQQIWAICDVYIYCIIKYLLNP